MATHGKRTHIAMDNAAGTLTDITNIGRDATYSRSADMADASHFGTQDKEYVPGMTDATFSVKGLYTPAQEQMVQEVLDAQSADLLPPPGTITIVYGPQGNRPGEPMRTFEAYITSLETSGSVGDLVSMSVNFQRTGGTVNGVFPA